MPRAVIVAAGNILDLPVEVQAVANTLSEAGWQVRLCTGTEATRAGLLAAAGEGDVDLAWFGVHSGSEGFLLSDGAWPPTQLGTWLRNVSAQEAVLNSCYSAEHVDTIRRIAEGAGLVCTIAPEGVDAVEAWRAGVSIAETYVRTRDMREAVRGARGAGGWQYRYIPAGGGDRMEGGRRRMPADEIREQLSLLVQAVQGDARTGTPGLLMRVNEISQRLDAIEGQITDMQQRSRQTTTITPAAAGMIAGSLGVVAVLLFMLFARMGGGL